jgi:hypothetical protein
LLFVLEQAVHTFFAINVKKNKENIIPLKFAVSTNVIFPLCAPTPFCYKNVSYEMGRMSCDISG